jgi:hypothetical protein
MRRGVVVFCCSYDSSPWSKVKRRDDAAVLRLPRRAGWVVGVEPESRTTE